MKKKISLFAIAMAWLFAAGQTTLVSTGRSVTIKNRTVTPVEVKGTGSLFKFDGVCSGNLLSTRHCFKVLDYSAGEVPIDYNRCDSIFFEFAEYYNNNRGIPLYYIKRMDGLYMTLVGGFSQKMSSPIPRKQHQEWLISVSTCNTAPRNNEACYSFLLANDPSPNGYSLIIYNTNRLGFNPNLTLTADQKDRFFLKPVSALTRPINIH